MVVVRRNGLVIMMVYRWSHYCLRGWFFIIVALQGGFMVLQVMWSCHHGGLTGGLIIVLQGGLLF